MHKQITSTTLAQKKRKVLSPHSQLHITQRRTNTTTTGWTNNQKSIRPNGDTRKGNGNRKTNNHFPAIHI